MDWGDLGDDGGVQIPQSNFMTMQSERISSIHYAREFLQNIAYGFKGRRIPRDIRQEAFRRLRHYPTQVEFNIYFKAKPEPA